MDIENFLASLPTPSATDVNNHIQLGHRYTLVLLRKGPASRDDEARNLRLQFEHLQYLTKLQLAGKLLINGPIMAEHDLLGVSVYVAEFEEAFALAVADPKVKAGYLTVEAIPWLAVLMPE
jgi:uncharacterized protein YciI